MPTGLKNSPDLGGPGGMPEWAMQPRQAVNRQFTAIIATTGLAQPLPPVHVPPGANVSVRGHNGATGNTAVVRASVSRADLLQTNGGNPITPDTEISFPVDNVGQIWIVGTAGDGVVVAIRAPKR